MIYEITKNCRIANIDYKKGDVVTDKQTWGFYPTVMKVTNATIEKKEEKSETKKEVTENNEEKSEVISETETEIKEEKSETEEVSAETKKTRKSKK